MNFIYPLSRYIKITQVYWSQHLGIDFGWNDGAYCNQPIVAIEDGTVVGCADGYGNTYPNQRIYGNYVNISHGGGWWSIFQLDITRQERVVGGREASIGRPSAFDMLPLKPE